MTRTWLRSHPVLAYYALVFAISWGGILIAVAGWYGENHAGRRAAPDVGRMAGGTWGAYPHPHQRWVAPPPLRPILT